MRDAERARDLTKACALFVHVRCNPLILSPKRAALRCSQQLLETADLSLGWALRLRVA
jgi:hypothetical protein